MRASPVDLSSIARPSGAFAMVAADQRESLRTIYRDGTGILVGDEVLRAFKRAVARVLSPHASAILLDRLHGLRPDLRAEEVDPDCGLIIAADSLVQLPGEPVTDTDLDAGLDPVVARTAGAVALKLLVIWRDDAERDRRERVAGDFIELCRGGGLISIVEAIVRRPVGSYGEWDREAAAREAAREMGALKPDLYKAEMPFLGQAEASVMADASRQLSEAAGGPWVVLSAGVPPDRFESAVEAACQGGASGFLAGRAIWSDAVSIERVDQRLTEVSVPRLERLGALVDRMARPWWDTRSHEQ